MRKNKKIVSIIAMFLVLVFSFVNLRADNINLELNIEEPKVGDLLEVSNSAEETGIKWFVDGEVVTTDNTYLVKQSDLDSEIHVQIGDNKSKKFVVGEYDNVAMDKTASAEAHRENNEPFKAIDGDLDTRWDVDMKDRRDDLWFLIDLEGLYTIKNINISFESAFGKEYKLLYSDNGIDYIEFHYEENGSVGWNYHFDIGEFTARYIKFEGVKRGTEYGYGIQEFEVRGVLSNTNVENVSFDKEHAIVGNEIKAIATPSVYNLIYKWYVENEEVGEGDTYIPQEVDFGKILRVDVYDSKNEELLKTKSITVKKYFELKVTNAKGEGKYLNGEAVEVNYLEIDGREILDWTIIGIKEDDIDLNGDVISFKMPENNVFIQANTEIKKTTVTIESYFEESQIIETNLECVDFGSMIEIDSNEYIDGNDEFRLVGWLENGQYMNSSEGKTNFVVTESKKITIIFAPTNKNVAIFTDTNGSVLDIQYLDKDEEIRGLSKEPTKPGYEFIGFYDELDKVSEDMLFKAKYKRVNDNLFTVKVNEDMYELKYNDVLELNGSHDFVAWVEKGKVISYNKNQKITVLKDRNIKEITEGSSKPTIYIDQIDDLREGYQSYLGQFYIPEGYELIEVGLLVNNSVLPKWNDLNSKKLEINSINEDTNEFLASIKENNILQYVRPYLVYKDFDKTKHVIYEELNETFELIVENGKAYVDGNELITIRTEHNINVYKVDKNDNVVLKADKMSDNTKFSWWFVNKEDNIMSTQREVFLGNIGQDILYKAVYSNKESLELVPDLDTTQNESTGPQGGEVTTWSAEHINNNSDDYELQGYNGIKVSIPANALKNTFNRIRGSKLSNLNNGSKVVNYIFRNNSEKYDVTIELVAESYGAVATSGIVTIPKGETLERTIVVPHGFVNPWMILYIRNDIGGNQNENIELDIVGWQADTYPQGDPSISNSNAVKLDSFNKSNQEHKTIEYNDENGLIMFYGDVKEEFNAFAKVRNIPGDNEGKITIYIKVSNNINETLDLKLVFGEDSLNNLIIEQDLKVNSNDQVVIEVEFEIDHSQDVWFGFTTNQNVNRQNILIQMSYSNVFNK